MNIKSHLVGFLFILILISHITESFKLKRLKRSRLHLKLNDIRSVNDENCTNKASGFFVHENKRLKGECDNNCDCDGLRTCVDGLCTGSARAFRKTKVTCPLILILKCLMYAKLWEVAGVRAFKFAQRIKPAWAQ